MLSKKHFPHLALLLVFIVSGAAYWVFSGDKTLRDIVPLAKESAINFDPTSFAPHKALYQIELVSTKSGSQIVNISGQMFYEWQPTCEAWATNHRFNMLYEYADTPALQITSDFTTFETFDGHTLNFSSQRKRGGEIFEALRGIAKIEPGQEGLSTFSIPEGLEHDLPEGTYFPMRHTVEVANKIVEGKNFFNAIIYDGSDEDGPVEVNTFIGDKVNALARLDEGNSKNIDSALINTPARQVRLAFFPLAENESASDYEMELVFHDNGVISDMLIEYSDFSVSQKLVALEKLKSNCETDRDEKE